VYAKQTKYTVNGCIFFLGIRIPFFDNTFYCDEFDKMQIPYTIGEYCNIPTSVYSLFGDDWNLRFCALITVGALFIFEHAHQYGRKNE